MEAVLEKTCNILVVEDDLVSSLMMQEMLINWLFEVKVVNSLNGAYEALRMDNFDIVLLDLNLPDKEGMDTLIDLHNNYKNIPIVIVTVIDEEKEGLKALSYGAQDYLVKGRYNIYTLKKTINYAIERKRIESELRRSQEELEKRVQERTQELWQANKLLQLEINEHQKTENSLIESEKKLRTVLEAVKEGITFSDDEGRFYIYNSEMERLTGYSMQEANASLDFSKLLYPDPVDRSGALDGLTDLINKGSSREVESKIVRQDKQSIYVLISSTIIYYGGRRMFLSVYRDITERRKAQEALCKAHDELEERVRERTQELAQINEELKFEITIRYQAQNRLQESESRYRLLAENVTDVVMLADLDFHWLYISPSVVNLMGYSVQEAMQKPVKELLSADSYELFKKSFKEDMRKRGNFPRSRILELECRRSDGTSVWLEVSINAIYNAQGEPFRLIGVARDISERKKVMQEIVDSLREKEILLQEVHHRVKNNLQIISSLLNLQSMRIKDKQALEVFQESNRSIKSMALIHEKLYKSFDLSKIDFREYVCSLAEELFNSYNVNVSLINITITIDNVFFDINTAIPCGLMINELISNTLKYAFPGDRSGEIIISLTEQSDMYVFVFSDNGVGLPGNIMFPNAESLGLQLISSLANQLDGTLEIDRTAGTRFTITFKKPHTLVRV
ncbi:MAG: PAS domain S-box protein [Candidatus Omnitrophota bacterium]|jgi:PAS domain S-box-containing protein